MPRHILAEGHVPSPIVVPAKLPHLVVTLEMILANNGRVPQPIIDKIEALKRIGYKVVRSDSIEEKRAEFYFESTNKDFGWNMGQKEIDDWFAEAMQQSLVRGPSPLQPMLWASTVAISMATTPIHRNPDKPIVLKQPDPIPVGGRKILIESQP